MRANSELSYALTYVVFFNSFRWRCYYYFCDCF